MLTTCQFRLYVALWLLVLIMGWGFLFCFLLETQCRASQEPSKALLWVTLPSLCLSESGSDVAQAGVSSLITKDDFELLTSCPNLFRQWRGIKAQTSWVLEKHSINWATCSVLAVCFLSYWMLFHMFSLHGVLVLHGTDTRLQLQRSRGNIN